MPAYKVTIHPNPDHKVRVVIANTPAQATKYVTPGYITTEAISGQEVGELVRNGIGVEDARQAQQDLPLEGSEAT
jgi:hypothetical protein